MTLSYKLSPVLYVGKVMPTFFRCSQCKIYMDYLEKGKMCRKLYFAELLGRFGAEVQSTVVTAELVEFCCELVPFYRQSFYFQT